MDSFFLESLVIELKQHLIGLRVNQILQYGRNDFLFKFRTKHHPIFFSLNSYKPIFFISSKTIITKPRTTPFSMTLTKYLKNAQIEGLYNIPFDRVLKLTFRQGSLNGNLENYYFFLELIPKAANAILTDAHNKIIASFSYPPQRGRSYTQGMKYVLPEQNTKINPFELKQTDFEALTSNKIDDTKKLTQALVKNLLGFSPMLASEVSYIAQNKATSPWEAFCHIIKHLSSNKKIPSIYISKENSTLDNFNLSEKDLVLSPISLSSQEGYSFHTFNSFNQAAAEYFSIFMKLHAFNNQKIRLMTVLKKRIQRLKRLNEKLQKEYKEAEKSEQLKNFGELILNNLKNIQKGQKKTRLVNYFDPLQQEVEIPLNPNLNPQENAQKYFKKYNKAKKSIPIKKARLKIQNNKFESLEKIATKLDQASSISQLLSIEKKLASLDIKVQKIPISPRLAEKDKQAKYRQFRTSDGMVILVGKNKETNEYLTYKLASDNDFWLHAAGQSGSHVVVRNPNRMNKLSERSLKEAAQIAAYFSKARNSSRALVHYTQRKYVKKAKGKSEGKVFLRSYRTISVKPGIPSSAT